MIQQILEKGISSIDPSSSSRKSIFEDFAGDVFLADALKLSMPPIKYPINSISESLWDIETTIHRLKWQKDLLFEKQIDIGRWFIYAQADIRLFHIEIRSLMDHLGLCIKYLCVGKKPKDSFSTLREKHSEYFEKSIISKEFHDLIDSCNWFDEFKKTRDKIVHEGAKVDVFGMNEGEPILFWVRKKNSNIIQDSPFLHNENGVLNFENYASFYMANIYSTLDTFSEIAYELSGIKRTQFNGASRLHGGISVICEWMNSLLEDVQKT